MTLPTGSASEVNSFRSFLAQLDAEGQLAEVAMPVDPEGFELSAIASALHDGPAVLFTGTGRFPAPCRRRRYAPPQGRARRRL